MSYTGCKQIHKRLYTDAYESRFPMVVIDHVRFPLQAIGYKYCAGCEFFPMKEEKKHCKCCGSMLKRSKTTYEKRKERWINKKGYQDKIILTADELQSYSTMAGERIPRKKRAKKLSKLVIL
jgi:hypothetical protein